MSADIYPKVSLLEERLKFWRNEIVRCLDKPTFLSQLAANDVFNEDEKSRLHEIYQNRTTTEAGEAVLDSFGRSSAPNKWMSFINALEQEELVYVKSLLVEDNVGSEEDRLRGRKLIRLFGPELEKTINPIDIISSLVSKKAITEVNRDEVLNLCQSKSRLYGIMCLLRRMQSQLRPREWYYAFLCALRDNDYTSECELLEPDFLECPHMFDPEKNSCGASEKRSQCEQSLEGTDKAKERSSSSTDCTEALGLKGQDSVHEDDAVLQSDEDELDSDSEYKNDFQNPKLNLRDYQYELAERAIQGENTIICAETGTGKTWVAMHIVSEHLSKATKGTRKVVVMARTGILIRQQFDRFKKVFPKYNTKFISGGEDESAMLHVFVKDADILCFTPQILVNNLENGNIPSLAVFSLLIFDECHHTKGSGSYGELARRYLTEKFDKVAGLPQIVGLTASIGVGNSKNEEDAVEYITKVCAALDVKRLSTVERCRTSIEKHVNTPKEDTIKMTVRSDDICKKMLIENMIKTEEILDDICFSVCEPDIIDVLDKRPRERGTFAYYGWTIQIDKTAKRFVHDPESLREITTCATYLNVYSSALEVNTLLQIRDVMKYLANETKAEAERRSKFTDQEKELFENFKELQKDLTKKSKVDDADNPNVEVICDQLTKTFQEKGPDSRAMVFVKARATCIALADNLNNRLDYKAHSLYGKMQVRSMKGMSQEVQTEVLLRFNEGRFKIIVCTSVAIEGIDVPDCNIVINYNFSGNEITKIQMRGRSRTHDASSLTLGSEKLVEKDKVNVYKANLMYKAMNTFKNMDAHKLENKLDFYQREEVRKQINKTDLLGSMKNRQSTKDMEVLCVKCKKYICHTSKMRTLPNNQHFVITEGFRDQIDRKPHPKPAQYAGIVKKEKMSCKNCGQEWGMIAEKIGLDLFVLKLENLLFREEYSGDTNSFQKWDLAPKITECTVDEITNLLAYQTSMK
ncbi:antiviral innate immune response receptor RIG-I-like isoform X2 [Mya arenaria]|uniref:antiviral innate immune response receptor RIG-I-like isoform X2 n=1 Tax=Mya arenaria TaxID=6604 RepID=UPI0022E1DAAC|nr:antiviral innate immune response receptor RIG-I-like isoform X2 [Mya arenaria]